MSVIIPQTAPMIILQPTIDGGCDVNLERSERDVSQSLSHFHLTAAECRCLAAALHTLRQNRLTVW
jgi:hypothetical protein